MNVTSFHLKNRKVFTGFCSGKDIRTHLMDASIISECLHLGRILSRYAAPTVYGEANIRLQAGYYISYSYSPEDIARAWLASTLTPGPMVEARVIRLT